MKKRYIVLLLFIGIICYQIFYVERSEYIAGQNRYYTYYEKYFDNDVIYHSSLAFDNDEYNLKLITDKITLSLDESEKIRIELKSLYEKLYSNSSLNFYKSSIDRLSEYKNDIKHISSDLKFRKNQLTELNSYIRENENELKSKLFYENEINFHIEKVEKIDSVLSNYSNFSDKLISTTSDIINEAELELKRQEREIRRIRENRNNNSFTQYSNNGYENNYNSSNSNYGNSNNSSGVKYYTNKDGYRVQSPTYYNSQPKNATALCKDGTYSFSRNRRGTCSGHGGVQKWL